MITTNTPISRKQKVDMMVDDLKSSLETGDIDLHNRTMAEFYNLQAQEARKRGDQLTILLLVSIEESNKLGMRGTSSVLNALAMYHRAGKLNDICGEFLGPLCFEICQEILRQIEIAKLKTERE